MNKWTDEYTLERITYDPDGEVEITFIIITGIKWDNSHVVTSD